MGRGVYFDVPSEFEVYRQLSRLFFFPLKIRLCYTLEQMRLFVHDFAVREGVLLDML